MGTGVMCHYLKSSLRPCCCYLKSRGVKYMRRIDRSPWAPPPRSSAATLSAPCASSASPAETPSLVSPPPPCTASLPCRRYSVRQNDDLKKLIQTVSNTSVFRSGVKASPEHLHFGAQLCHTVMLRLVDGEKGVATAVGALPAAEVTFGQVSLQTPPLYLHRTTWEHRSTRMERPHTKKPCAPFICIL